MKAAPAKETDVCIDGKECVSLLSGRSFLTIYFNAYVKPTVVTPDKAPCFNPSQSCKANTVAKLATGVTKTNTSPEVRTALRLPVTCNSCPIAEKHIHKARKTGNTYLDMTYSKNINNLGINTINPTIAAVIANIRTAPAARSFVRFIASLYSGETKSAKASIDELIASAANTRPMAKAMTIHSSAERFSRKPANNTQTAAKQ